MVFQSGNWCQRLWMTLQNNPRRRRCLKTKTVRRSDEICLSHRRTHQRRHLNGGNRLGLWVALSIHCHHFFHHFTIFLDNWCFPESTENPRIYQESANLWLISQLVFFFFGLQKTVSIQFQFQIFFHWFSVGLLYLFFIDLASVNQQLRFVYFN